jgi:putative inorganic carbon (HCO3(-)) transporter
VRLRDVLVAALIIGLAVSITLSEASLVALAAWLVWARRGRLGSRDAWPLLLPMLAFAGWSLVGAALSAVPSESLRSTKTLLPLATVWVVFGVLDDAAAARRFVSSLLWALGAVAVVSIVQVATCAPARLDAVDPALPSALQRVFGKCRRAHGFYSIYMTLAGVLVVTLATMLPVIAAAGRRGVAVALAWVTSAVALALTLVRGAWLGFGAGVLVALAGVRRRWIAVAAVAVVAALLVAVPRVRERAETIGDPADATTRERLAMADAGLRMLREHPVTGVGLGGVKRLYPVYAPPEAVRRHTSHLHNTPLQIAVERGLVGLALWLWIFVAFFVRAGRVLRRVPATGATDRALVIGALAAVTTFLVSGLFEYNFGDTEVLLVTLAVMALPFVVERDLAGHATHDLRGRVA